MLVWIRKARPPPLSFSRSFLTMAKFGMSASFLSFNLVSWKAAILIFSSIMNFVIWSILFLMPLQLNWRTLILCSLLPEVGGGGPGVGGEGGVVGGGGEGG